jgi:hypothetical protein
VGSIQTNVQNAGGIMGYAAGSGNMIQKFWSDVDITTTVDYIAGIVGFYPGGESESFPSIAWFWVIYTVPFLLPQMCAE